MRARGAAALTLALLATLASCRATSDHAAPGLAPQACAGAAEAWSSLDLVAGAPGGRGLVDGSFTAAHFSDPRALVGDGAGHLFLADDQTLRVVDLSAGTVATIAGGLAAGSADGPIAASTFDTPSGLALADGKLYVTDTENNTIRLIDLAAHSVTTVAGSTAPGAVDASGAAARFQEPEGLALAPNGELYIADTDNDTIRVMAIAAGDAVTTVAGLASAPAGPADGVGEAARFAKPRAVALSPSGDLFVVDDHNQSIRRVATSTRTVTTLATFGVSPAGICIVGTDVVVSLADHTVVRVGPSGTVTPIAGKSGSAGLVDGAGADARFKFPAGLYSDGKGTVYVADEGNFVVRALTLADGSVRTAAGVVSVGSSDGAGAAVRFSAPQGMVVDGSSAYVADTGNATIRLVALDTGAVTTFAGAAGQPGAGDGVHDVAHFQQPQGLALDPTARVLYVADTGNHAVRRVDLATAAVATLPLHAVAGDSFVGLEAPTGVALDGGRLYVVDSSANTVLAVDPSSGEVTTLAGTPHVSGSADGTKAIASFSNPLGVAADGSGNLFVTDSFNHTIRKIALATGGVSTLAGQPGVQGANDGDGHDARFGYPASIIADGCDLYVADPNNNVVRRIDARTGAVTTVLGSATASGVRLGALPTQIALPSAIAKQPGGGLLVLSENALLRAR